MLTSQCFSYLLQFPESPDLSAFINSGGRFSSIDDDGLETEDEDYECNYSNVKDFLRKNDVKDVPENTVALKKGKLCCFTNRQQQALLSIDAISRQNSKIFFR